MSDTPLHLGHAFLLLNLHDEDGTFEVDPLSTVVGFVASCLVDGWFDGWLLHEGEHFALTTGWQGENSLSQLSSDTSANTLCTLLLNLYSSGERASRTALKELIEAGILTKNEEGLHRGELWPASNMDAELDLIGTLRDCVKEEHLSPRRQDAFAAVVLASGLAKTVWKNGEVARDCIVKRTTSLPFLKAVEESISRLKKDNS